jgi:hypothetical protein
VGLSRLADLGPYHVFLAPGKNLPAACLGQRRKRDKLFIVFGFPCTMFGFCDESPEANPHNPIFCGVFTLDPCCELCCGRMGQIAKTTVKISSGRQGLIIEAS